MSVNAVAITLISNLSYSVLLESGTLSLSKEGCSQAVTARISPVPTSNVYLVVGNGSLSTGYGLYVQNHPDNTITFPANGSSSQSFAICSYANATANTLRIPISVAGNTMAQYNLNRNNMTVIVTAPVSPTPPVINNNET